jgi:hypothetical protein
MFWRVYSVVLALFLLPAYSVIMKASPGIFDYVDMIVSVGALMGFIGFAYEFRIISMSLWKFYFFLVIGWDVFYNIFISMIFDLAVHLPNEEKTSWIGVAVSFALIVPEYVALFLYGFKSEPLWEGVETA